MRVDWNFVSQYNRTSCENEKKKTLPTVVGRLYHGVGANCVTVAQASSRVSAADISRH